MTTITVADFKNMIQDSDITDANATLIMKQAVHRLNTYGAGLTEFTDSMSVSSAAAGAIYETARIIYYGYYKGQSAVTTNIGGTTPPNLISNPVIEAQLRELANQLKGRSIYRT